MQSTSNWRLIQYVIERMDLLELPVGYDRRRHIPRAAVLIELVHSYLNQGQANQGRNVDINCNSLKDSGGEKKTRIFNLSSGVGFNRLPYWLVQQLTLGSYHIRW